MPWMSVWMAGQTSQVSTILRLTYNDLTFAYSRAANFDDKGARGMGMPVLTYIRTRTITLPRIHDTLDSVPRSR